MERKKKRAVGAPSAEGRQPNPSLNRAARTGQPTEDEMLLARPRKRRPQPLDPSQAEFIKGDPWRVMRITSEFVHAMNALAEVGAAVTVFGSARTPETDPMYQAALELGRLLAQSGFAVVTGGGPGIMEAANRGAKEVNGVSIGCNIELPMEQAINPYVDLAVNFRYFFIRKTMLAKYSEGFVMFPGGYGTLDELFEALTLIQTEKLGLFPVVLFGKSYWQGLIDWIREQILGTGRISPADINLFHITDSPREACKILLDAYDVEVWKHPRK